MSRLLLLSSLTVATLCFAEPSAEVASAEALVQKGLVRPLLAREQQRSRFSRARLPPAERRVRITDEAPRTDAKGATFFAFAIDARHGWMADDEKDAWQKNSMTGCVYPATGAIFVKSGPQHRPAELVLGKKVKPGEAHVCTGAAVAQAD